MLAQTLGVLAVALVVFACATSPPSRSDPGPGGGGGGDPGDADPQERPVADIPRAAVLLHDARVLIPLACWDPDTAQIEVGEDCLSRVGGTAQAELADGTIAGATGKHHQKLCGSGRAGRWPDETAVLDVAELGERGVAAVPELTAAALVLAPAGPPELLSDKRSELLAFVGRTVEEPVVPSGLQVLQALFRDLDGDGAEEIAYSLVYTSGTWPPLFAGIALEPADGEAPLAVLAGHDWRSGAVSAEILATSDLDRDGAHELILYERWVDGYYVEVRELGADEPMYRIGCGES